MLPYTESRVHIECLISKRRSQKLDIRQEVALEDMASSKNPVTAISSHVIANPLAAPHRQSITLHSVCALCVKYSTF